jgi:hypothetical protein
VGSVERHDAIHIALRDLGAGSGNSSQRVTHGRGYRSRYRIGGHPAALASKLKIAESNGAAVIEDCAQSHGAKFDGRATGSGSA